jgi:ABC-2 type transport system ATP-binding protein
MTTAILQAQQLVKQYHAADAVAVKGVSFEVQRGEIVSLLGPNGAGKSTLISMLSCLIDPTQGDAVIDGHSIRDDSIGVRKVIGVVPQDIALYDSLTAQENLQFWGSLYGLSGSKRTQRSMEILDIIGLRDRSNQRVGQFSGGMKRRLNIGVALLHRPPVIFMDEPTVGIDPQSRRSILDSVVRLKEQGHSVIYTSHYMEEVEEISDRIAILDKGQIIACGELSELLQLVSDASAVEIHFGRAISGEEAVHVLSAYPTAPSIGNVHLSEDGTQLTLRCTDSESLLPQFVKMAYDIALPIKSVRANAPDLEMVFLHLTGKQLRD